MTDWLDEITNNDESSYSYDFSGWGDHPEGDNTQIYQPEGYRNPTWDSSEHYSYEPGYNYPEESSEDAFFGGAGEPAGGLDNFGGITPWGDTKGATSKGNIVSSGSGNKNVGRSSDWGSMVSMSVSTPTKPFPTMEALPAYAVPEYDKNRVKALRQSKAAMGINSLRDAVSEAITRSVSMDNPYLRKMLLRSSLKGFGEGLGNVMTSAETQAESAYAQEYAPKVQGSLVEYQAKVNRINTMYQAAVQEYLNTMAKTTSVVKM